MNVEKGRLSALLLLVVNTILIIIVLVSLRPAMCTLLSLDEDEDESSDDYSEFKDILGVLRTVVMIFYSVPAMMVALAAVITGVHHVRVWNSVSAAAAQATAWIAWMLVLLSMCLMLKDVVLMDKQQTAMVKFSLIFLTASHLIYTLALYVPNQFRRNFDPSQSDE